MRKEFQWNHIAASREVVIWAALLLLVFILGFQQFFSPVGEKIAGVRVQLDNKKKELVSLKQAVTSQEAATKRKTSQVDLVQRNIAQKVKENFEKSNMSPDVVVSELLTQLTSAELAKSALLEKFTFTSEEKQAGFSQMKLDLKLVGDYDGIAAYLRRLKTLPYLLRVNSLQLKPSDPSTPGRVEMVANSILYVGEVTSNPQPSAMAGRSDTGADLLIDLNTSKNTKTPFASKPREMLAWSVHELKLTSTMAGSARPTALINGQVFELGDEIANFKLVEIRPREVVLRRGDVEHILKISEEPGIFREEPKIVQPVTPKATPPDTHKLLKEAETLVKKTEELNAKRMEEMNRAIEESEGGAEKGSSGTPEAKAHETP